MQNISTLGPVNLKAENRFLRSLIIWLLPLYAVFNIILVGHVEIFEFVFGVIVFSFFPILLISSLIIYFRQSKSGVYIRPTVAGLYTSIFFLVCCIPLFYDFFTCNGKFCEVVPLLSFGSPVIFIVEPLFSDIEYESIGVPLIALCNALLTFGLFWTITKLVLRKRIKKQQTLG